MLIPHQAAKEGMKRRCQERQVTQSGVLQQCNSQGLQATRSEDNLVALSHMSLQLGNRIGNQDRDRAHWQGLNMCFNQGRQRIVCASAWQLIPHSA